MPCALRASRIVAPLAQVDLVHQRYVADGGGHRPRQIRVVVVCVLCLANAAIANARRVARLPCHHYPIPSARGEA